MDTVTSGGLRQKQRKRLTEGSSALVIGSTFWGWAGPALVMIFGGFLRFYRLSKPDAVVFDETYYVPDANSILHHGVEFNHVSNINSMLVAGNPHIFRRLSGQYGELVAHPPLGKIFMAAGQWVFGLTPFGWRFSVAVVGTLSILMLARITRRLTRSTLLGCVAGLLLALDGLELVLSRTAILDIFVMFWVLAAFGLLVIDRDRTRSRLEAAAAEGGTADLAGPKLGIRWLRVAAGLCLGAACASKWNGGYFLIAFAGLAVAWDFGARRAAGDVNWLAGGLRRDVKWLPVWFLLAPAVVYTASWSGWFATSDGYDRNWAAANGNHTPVWNVIDSWYQYNHWMLQFGLDPDQLSVLPFQPARLARAGPADLLLLVRGKHAELPHAAQHGVGSTGHRHADHLVGRRARDPVLPGLVAHRADRRPGLPPRRAAGLASRGAAAGHRGGLAAVDLVLLPRQPHRVLLLRRRLRAVHDHRYRPVPRDDHRPGPRRTRPAGDRRRRRRPFISSPCSSTSPISIRS